MRVSERYPAAEQLGMFYTELMELGPHWVVHLVGPPVMGGPMTVVRLVVQCEDDISIVLDKATDYARELCEAAGRPFHASEWMCPSLPVKRNCN